VSPTLTPMSLSWSLRRLRSNRLEGYVVAPLLAVLLGVTLAGCSDDDSGKDEPTLRLTRITKFDATSVQPLRQDFCDSVPEAAVEAVVGDVDSVDAYANGEAHRITGRVTDVAHEFSCTWVGDRGDVARAWIFAPRVTGDQALALVRAAERAPGCQAIDGHDFGTPSTGALCTVRGGRAASYRGLFVDTWLVCSLTDRRRQLTEERLLDRAGKWCVQAATAASAG